MTKQENALDYKVIERVISEVSKEIFINGMAKHDDVIGVGRS